MSLTVSSNPSPLTSAAQGPVEAPSCEGARTGSTADATTQPGHRTAGERDCPQCGAGGPPGRRYPCGVHCRLDRSASWRDRQPPATAGACPLLLVMITVCDTHRSRSRRRRPGLQPVPWSARRGNARQAHCASCGHGTAPPLPPAQRSAARRGEGLQVRGQSGAVGGGGRSSPQPPTWIAHPGRCGCGTRPPAPRQPRR